MILKIKSHPPLDSFIEDIVYYRGLSFDYSMMRRLPDGSINLVIDLNDDPKAVYDNYNYTEKYKLKKGWLSGIQNEFITYEPGKEGSMMVVQFKPGCSFPFLNIPSEIF